MRKRTREESPRHGLEYPARKFSNGWRRTITILKRLKTVFLFEDSPTHSLHDPPMACYHDYTAAMTDLKRPS
jgi:hypothetical protein